MGFFHGFVNFLVGQEGHLRKLINVSNRALGVVCWSTLCFVWSTAWANSTVKYSNPDVRYSTYFNPQSTLTNFDAATIKVINSLFANVSHKGNKISFLKIIV